MAVLVIAEHDNASLRAATRPAVTAAHRLAQLKGAEVAVLVAGHGCAGAAAAAARLAGVARVLVADDPALAHGLAEPLVATIEPLAADYDAVLAPASTFGKNVLPRLAARLDVQQISEISAILAADTFLRPVYAGNALATVVTHQAQNVITVRMASFEAAPDTPASAPIKAVAAAADPGLSVFVGREDSGGERPELTSARVVISGGRGLGSAESFKLLEPIADRLGAAIGASRAAVDAGYVPNDWQVGQTGKVVAPDLYIAVGISGAIQHLAGMKDSKVIVAINKDEDAPIFQVADYGLVADLFKVLPELAAALGGDS